MSISGSTLSMFAHAGMAAITGTARQRQMVLGEAFTLADADPLDTAYELVPTRAWYAAPVQVSGDGGASPTASSLNANATAPTFSKPVPYPGKAIVDVGGFQDLAQGMVLQADGKLVVAGGSLDDMGFFDISVVRLNADGTLDTSFSIDGKALFRLSLGDDFGSGATVQPDGKIIVAGSSSDGVSVGFSLVRLNADGTLDTSFGRDGQATFGVGAFDDRGYGITLQADGKIIVAGTSTDGNGRSAFSVARLDADGTLDTGFSDDGKALLGVGGLEDQCLSVALQPDGKIILAGYGYNGSGDPDFALMRLNGDGTLDTSFNGSGKMLLDVGGAQDLGSSVVLQPDGKIVMAGSSFNGTDNDFALVRLNADGTLDTSFSGDGKALLDFGNGNDEAWSVVLQPDGKILATGCSANAGGGLDFSLVRLNADGTLDTSFSGDGKATFDVRGDADQATSVVVQADGRIVVAGSDGDDFTLLRINADGTLDTGFGDQAVTTLGGTQAYTEGASPVLLDADVAVFDAELAALNGGAGNYAGASITLRRVGGANAQDSFAALGSLAFSNGNAVLAGLGVGTVSNAAGQLGITFNANATQARVNEVLRSIGYANLSDAPEASVDLQWTFLDGATGDALSATGNTTVRLYNVNDAPTGGISISGTPVEQQTLSVSSTLVDPDGFGGPMSYQWLRNGKAIDGATASTYQLAWADVGQLVSVRVSYVDAYGHAESVTSANVTDVLAINAEAPTFMRQPHLAHPGSVLVDFNEHNDISMSVMQQPDGRLVVAGYTGSTVGGVFEFALARLNADGSPDTTFGDGGTVSAPVGTSGYATCATLQPDGKIVLGGTSKPTPLGDSDFTVARFNADGSLDTSFGAGGWAVTSFAYDSRVNSIMVQADGKLLLAGYGYEPVAGNSSDFVLLRLNADGTRDTSFDGDGMASFDVGGYSDRAISALLQPDGKILVAGNSQIGSTIGISLVRVNADGTLDHTFSGDGQFMLNTSGQWENVRKVLLQPDGKVIVLGFNATDAIVLRLNADGSLDTTFSGDGVASIKGKERHIADAVLQADGRIVVSSSDPDDPLGNVVLRRLNADGSLDSSFGDGGQSTFDVSGNFDLAQSLTLQSDGKLVSTGNSYTGGLSSNDFSVIRFNADGTPDTSFGAFTPAAAATSLGDTASCTEGGAPVVLDADAMVYDRELAARRGGAGVYGGAVLTLARQGGPSAQDVFTGLGPLSLSAGLVKIYGIDVGSYTNGAGKLSITFNAQAEQARVNEVLRHIGYSNTSDAPPPSVTLAWTLRDGSGADALSTTDTSTVLIQNVDDPLTGSVAITGTPRQGVALGIASTLADKDGLGSLGYQWLRDGVAVANATKSSYTLTQADVGQSIAVTVTYTDAYGHAESRTTAATAAVANVNDAPTGSVTIAGTAAQNQTLTAVTTTLADADGLGALSYQWLRGGVAVEGATGTTYALTQADVGKAMAVRVSYVDGFGAAETKTSGAVTVANVNDAPTGEVLLGGTARQGETLTASHTLDDIDGMGAVSWQWLRAGAAITGATGASYTLVQADVGKAISVKAAYKDGFNYAESRTSAATAPVENVNDAPTGSLGLSGTAVQGQTLGAVTSTLADADGLGTLQYQWLRDGSAISSVATSYYKLVQADVGHAISLRVSYTDKLGTAESVLSAATAAVENVNDAPTGAVTISGYATQNQTLTAVTTTLADADGLGALQYQWLRGGVAVEGATGTTYALTQADVGKAMAVRVSYVDGFGAAETKASNATAAVGNVNDAPTGGVGIAGVAELGQTLTASHTLADTDGLGTVTWQWLRAGYAIAGATAASYTLTTADLGKAISVKASYVDGFNYAESRTSAATAPVVGDSLTGDAGGVVRADVLHGGAYASLVDGRAGNDQLWGEAGDDTVLGGSGDDVLYGGAGKDVLRGDAGADQLWGGADADVFVLQAADDSPPAAAARDRIGDFVRGEDRIDLAGLDADTATPALQAFTALIDASADFTAPGQLRFADGVLYGNTDDDADAEFAIELLGVATLDLSDFVLAR